MFWLVGRMGSPNRLQDRAMRQHTPRMLRQERQELELLRRKTDFFAVPQHAESFPVDHEATAHHWLRCRGRILHAAKRRANPREELFGSKRFRDVIVGTGVEGVHLVPFRPASRQHHDRHALGLPDLAAYLHAVDVGQPEIQDDQIRLVALGGRQGGAACHCG
jgi:hypothetical protein